MGFYTTMISGEKRIYAKKSVNFVILKLQQIAVTSKGGRWESQDSEVPASVSRAFVSLHLWLNP